MEEHIAQPTNPTAKIMIVDDDQFLLDMYSMKFKKRNYEVMLSLGPEDCLTKLREGYKPDVLIVDIIMPKMDGIELIKQVKKENLVKDVAIMVLSNQSTESDMNRAKEIGVDGYIIKALFTPSEVVSKVEEIYSKIKSK